MLLTTASLIAAGVAAAASTAGAIGSSVKRAQAQDEENRAYGEAKNYLTSQYYRDPLNSVGNRALLKSLDKSIKDSNDAVNNRAVAGGATFENTLAAKQANNEVMSGTYSRLLQGEDARRDRISAQQLQLSQNHSLALQRNFMQEAQDWQSWGSQMSSAALSVGSASLLDGAK